ncbi:hypothetical protein CJ030_MR8G019540 [Morella rubra]|uniref:Uncharacterized protein n=1 Tax=Morella rubra TaxID=262757 RepID=A0A6A1URN8_9ROSI|nr:hypothetical protein CJ030_MR8G019540 [Morella rubra]
MRRQSPINVDRKHEEGFPLWFRNQEKYRRYSCSMSQRESHTQKWRFSLEVLGTKVGYVRGLGLSVCSVGSSSSVSSVDLSKRLEEARLKIEEMRARQIEYEELLSSGQK